MIRHTPLALCLLMVAAPAGAAPPALRLPANAIETAQVDSDLSDLRLPVGRWSAGRLPTLDLKGALDQTAWRIPGAATNSLALMTDLSAQLQADGFRLIFDCASDDCGGFDFRYAAPILPEPEMHVDLGDFHYQVLIRGQGDSADYAALVTSMAGTTAFAELIRVRPAPAHQPQPAPTPGADPDPPPVNPAPPPGPVEPLAQLLDDQGHVALDDLVFASGSADLGAGTFASLAAIAGYLADHPDRTILIVGHTDVSGALAGNLALSRARAVSVVDRLVAEYGTRSDQLVPEGAGPLSPRTTNLSPEGRQKNRRVEAVLASTQ
jgi:OOP family OmpA-OmpF porin